MAIKPSSHGIVVEHKESGNRYASLDENFDPKNERKIRDLLPGESIMSYPVKSREEYAADTEDPEDSTSETSSSAVVDGK